MKLRMTYGVSIALNGNLTDVQIPTKTLDVLEWIRKKYKNSDIQFQGKLQDPLKETQYLSIFAANECDEQHANMHMLPSPFHEETYFGNIVILSTESDNQDEYEPNISSYVNLKSDHYNTIHQEWTFVEDEDEDDVDPEEDLDEEEELVEEEEEEEELVREVKTQSRYSRGIS